MDNAEQEIDTGQALKMRRKAEKLVAKKAAEAEAQNRFLRDHLKRERAFSDQTQRKFFEGWESLCLQVRSEQMVEELRQQQQCFGTVVDRKNGCIDRLLTVRDDIGEIHDKCLRRLRNIIDYYVRLKDFLTSSMLKRYETDCLQLLKDFREEVAAKEDYGNSQMEMLDASLAELLEKMKQDEQTGSDWLLENNDVNKCAQIEKCEILRDKNYSEMNALYRQLKATLDDYFRTVLQPERKTGHDRLVYYTQLEQEGIEKRRCQIAVAHLKKTQLEHTLALARIGGRRKLRSQYNHRRLLEMKVNVLKEQSKHLEAEHSSCLKRICSITHHLKKVLSEHFSWGEKIAKHAVICSQYETIQDQRFASRWFQPEVGEEHNDEDRFCDYLMNKINRVAAINIILREERVRLKLENDELRTKFKTFCSLHKITDSEKLLLCGQEVSLQP